ncbi:MAG: universal stress protein [Hyphomicrobiales bacterium]|nr:universal stress protein [Hyphomicrobiales bacterium]
MALKDLLVYVDQTDTSLARLRLAGDLAARNGSHLTALYIREWNRDQLDLRKSAEIGLVSAARLHDLDHQVAATIEAAADRQRSAVTELARERGLRAELIAVDGVASLVVPQYARYADLCILGCDELEGGPASINYTFSEQLLFVSGRPVLFVPPAGSFATLGRHIAVAWNSSRPAALALNDALPLIEHAEQTTIIMINPSGFIENHPGPPGEQIVEHLKRHGAEVTAARLEDVPRDEIADRLQDEAQARGADLMVAGAFGHPRLWEKMLGGVTHDLIARMRLPVFMSH